MDSKVETKYKNQDFIEFFDSLCQNNPIELEENNEKLDSYIENLEKLYSKYFRHFYSDISIYFFEMEYDDRAYFIENLTILNRRLIKLTDEGEIEAVNSDLLRNNIIKIIDHISSIEYNNVDIDKRIIKSVSESMNNYYKSITKAINTNLLGVEGDINKALEKMEEAEAKLDNTNNKLNELDGRLRNVNIDMIAVLSIFSAIIISFFGGLNFMGQALAAMNNANPKLTIIVITISGIVMFNVIYFLFLLIGKVIRVPIGFECKEENCKKCEDNCSLLETIWKKHIIFVVVNISLFMVIITVWLKLPGMFVTKTYIK